MKTLLLVITLYFFVAVVALYTNKDYLKLLTSLRTGILKKTFQPFFTAKLTKQGTRLGISFSYDIIKAHGGEITVASKEGEGTAFIIQLPA